MISRGLLFSADFTLTRKKGGTVNPFSLSLNGLNSQLSIQISKNSGFLVNSPRFKWIKLWTILKQIRFFRDES